MRFWRATEHVQWTELVTLFPCAFVYSMVSDLQISSHWPLIPIKKFTLAVNY